MGQQLPCSSNHSVPTSELEIDDVVSSSSNTSPGLRNQAAESKVTQKTGTNSVDGRIHYEDVEPSANASLSSYSQIVDSNLGEHGRQPEYPADEMKLGSTHDIDDRYGTESGTKVSRKCSLTSYRLVKDEIGHRRLNPQVPVSSNFCRPCSRYSQSKGIFNSTERLNRESLRTCIPQCRVQRSSPRAPRQVRSNTHQRSSSGIFGRRSSRIPAPAVGDSLSETNLPNVFRMPGAGDHPNLGMFLRFTNSNPFAHNEHIFRGLPGFSINRGFDNDGFFFFTVNISPQGSGRPRPTQATKEQIEKAVSQLKGLASDLEIKKGDTCPICLEQFRTTDDVVEMPCPCKRTFFHRKCAVDTLEKTKKIKCPNCRRWDGNNTGK